MTLILILSVLILLVAFIPIINEIKHDQFDGFNLKNAFILYYIIQLCLSGLLSLYFPSPFKSTTSMDIEGPQNIIYLQKAFFASFLGISFFQFGYYFTDNRKIKIFSFLPGTWRKNNVILILVVYFTLGIIGSILLIKSYGSLKNFLDSREEFRAGGLIGKGVFIYPATRLLTFAVLIFTIWKLRTFTKNNKYPLKKPIILLTLSIIPALSMGFRGLLILPFISFILVYNYLYKKIEIKKLIPISTIILIIFVLYGVFRQVPSNIEISSNQLIEIVKANPELAYGFVSRSKGIEVVASVIKKLDQTHEYDLGYKSLFEILTIWIPGKIWDDKPISTGVRFTTYFFGDNLNYIRGEYKNDWGGVSPTIIGEAYWNFGWLGIIVGLFFLGGLTKIIYLTFINNLNHNFSVLIYALIFVLFIMSAESFQGNINGFIMDIFVYIITSFFLKFRI